ncbi:MAG: hypothetical protein WC645_07375 [Candidatus Margulisiibacteriota bacterium]
MAKSIEHRLFSPRVLRRPFDLQKLQAKYPKVRPLLSSLRNHNPEKVTPRTPKIKPALAYAAVAAFLEQTPTIQEAVREDLEKQVLQPLKDKIDGQITRRQITAAGIALSSLLALGGATVYFMYYWGKAEEQAAINAFSKSLDNLFEDVKQNTDLADEADLQRKLSGRIFDFAPTFVPLRYPDNIHNLRNYNIPDDLAIDLDRSPAAIEVISMAQRSDTPELNAISLNANPRFSRQDFADFYLKVAGAPLIGLPDNKSYYSVIFRATEMPLDDIPMDFLSVLFFRGAQAREWHFMPEFDKLRAFSSDSSQTTAWRSAYSYAQYFSVDIDTAAHILAGAHPNSLRENNVRVFLRDDLVMGQLELTSEDPWQDRAACIKVGCNQLERLESVYHEYDGKVGVEMWGKRRDLPWWAWWLASVTYKYDLKKHGLGPSQIIIGLADRATNYQDVLRRYHPFLSGDDFSSSDNIIRTILDPNKSIFAKALVFDYIISTLERTIFADPHFREPATVAPFISDLKTAREYSLMYLASKLAMFPEFDFLAAKLLSIPHLPYYVDLLHVADLFNIPLEFPGLFYYRWESPDTVIYSEFIF